MPAQAPPGSVLKKYPVEPINRKSPVTPGVSIPQVPKASLDPVLKIQRAAQRVGLFKTNARRRVNVKPYVRKEDTGKVVPVRGHSREGEREDKIEQFVEREEGKRRAEGDLEAWKAWKAGGQQEKDLRVLLKRFRSMIESRAKVYRNKAPIPPAALDAEFKRQFMRALRTYDPSKGKLGSWVWQYLEAAKRFVARYQNPARIPEERIHQIGRFNRAREYLDELYGKPATDQEIADYAGIPVKSVMLLKTELRQGVPRSAFEEDPSVVSPSKVEEVLQLVWYDLDPQERTIFEYMRGIKGKPKIEKPGEIAKVTGMSNSKVSRLRASIAEKMEKFLNG